LTSNVYRGDSGIVSLKYIDNIPGIAPNPIRSLQTISTLYLD